MSSGMIRIASDAVLGSSSRTHEANHLRYAFMSSRDWFFCSRVTFDPISLKCNTVSGAHCERNYSTEPFPLHIGANIRLFVKLLSIVASELLVFVITIIVEWVETHLKRQLA